jgi:hypothetical protein
MLGRSLVAAQLAASREGLNYLSERKKDACMINLFSF